MEQANRPIGSPERAFVVDIRSGQPSAAVLMYDGVEEVEAVCSIDLLRRAGIAVTTIKCSCEDSEVIGLHNIRMRAENCFDNIAEDDIFDCIVVPGGRHATTILDCDDAKSFVNRHYKKGKIIAGCCTGLVVLSELGITANHKAAVPSALKHRVNAKEISDDIFVIDENVLTSKGMATIFEFNLTLIEMLFGRDAREAVEIDVVLD
ncbi:hypothetical protein P9112_008663 [Eukaryota sp. TZLM1-RC]